MGKIEIENVTFCYHDNGEAYLALDDISLSIDPGEFVCLIGHSGCGKSTLLSLLAGLAKPDAGTIKIDGVPVGGPSVERAMVFQNYSLFPWMTALKNVAFSIRQAYRNRGQNVAQEEASEKADRYLAQVGMAEAASKYPFQLSGGMQQRVAIARALAMESDILLLDEPFGALDARNRADLQNLLIDLWEKAESKLTVVFVTHDLNEAMLLSTKIVAMRPRRIDTVFDDTFPRPRVLDDLLTDVDFRLMRDELMAIFYKDKGKGTCGMREPEQDDDARGILHYADIQGGA